MIVIDSFPEKYPRLQHSLISIEVVAHRASETLPEDAQELMRALQIRPFGEAGNEDVFVRLKDGRTFAFTAFTPDDMKELMDQDGTLSFISPGMIVVRQMSEEALCEAIEECLKFESDGSHPLDHFGVLQRGKGTMDDP
jgi:hypothetical protein